MREGKPSYLEVVDANLEIHEDSAGEPNEVRSVNQVGQAKKEHLLKEKVHPIHQRQWCTAYDELVVQKRPRRALNEAMLTSEPRGCRRPKRYRNTWLGRRVQKRNAS